MVIKGKNNKDFKVVLLFLFAFLAISGIVFGFYGHEKAHIQINKYYGIDSHIELSGLTLLVVPENNVMHEEARLIHGINEAIGYQTLPFLVVISCFLMLICVKVWCFD